MYVRMHLMLTNLKAFGTTITGQIPVIYSNNINRDLRVNSTAKIKIATGFKTMCHPLID